MRRRQHIPRYAAWRDTITMRARALKPRRKRTKSGRSKARRAVAIGLGITLVVMLASYGAYTLVKRLHRSPEYIVTQIDVEGATLLTPEEVLEAAGLKPGLPILDYPIRRAQRDLVDNPMIRAATVVRRLPNTIIVRVVERVPIARIRAGGKQFLVDDEGFRLTDNGTLKTLPMIEGLSLKDKDPAPGTRIENDKLRTALLVLRLYLSSSIPELMGVESVNVYNLRNVRLYPMPGPKTRRGAEIMLGDGDFGQRLARLDAILRRTDRPIKNLDLRVSSRVPAVLE